MNRLKPWLLLALIFVAGFAGGVVVTRAAVHRFVVHAVKDPNYMRERIEKRMASRLRLDPQQRVKAHIILLNAQGELKALRAEFQPRFLAIMDQAQSEIAAALTPEQRKRFEQFQEENRPWWQPK